jgi:hypothetical protein
VGHSILHQHEKDSSETIGIWMWDFARSKRFRREATLAFLAVMLLR